MVSSWKGAFVSEPCRISAGTCYFALPACLPGLLVKSFDKQSYVINAGCGSAMRNLLTGLRRCITRPAMVLTR